MTKKKELIDFITSIALLILASIVLLFPSFKISDLKLTLMIIFGLYTLIKLTGFILILKEHDFENLFTGLISLGSLVALYLIKDQKYITLILLIWMGLMCLVKLKKADFYHDRKNKMWIFRLFILFIFLTSGLLTGINLAHDNSIQIVIIGYFFFINSILDVIDPIALYLIGEDK